MREIYLLSTSRVDLLPQQFEAVDEYFLALPRIRFLLAYDHGRRQDDPWRELYGEFDQSDALAVAGGERGRLRDAR